jgi:hypothetical protein
MQHFFADGPLASVPEFGELSMKTRIEFTPIARRHAQEHGVLEKLERLELNAWSQIDDLVELGAATGSETFIIRSRRITVSMDEKQTLIFKLDYPPRPSGCG